MFGPRTRASSFVADRHELQLHAGRGQTDHPGERAHRAPVHIANGAVSVAPRPVMMSISSPQASTATSLQLVPEPLAEAGRRIEQQLHAAEERLAQHRVAAQVRHQHLVEARHGEVRRARDLAQVAQRGREQRRRRLALVDVERAAVVEHDARSCDCRRRCGSTASQSQSTGGSSARNAQHRADHLLVRAQHPLRVDHALRPPGRSRREEHLGDGVAVDALRAPRRRPRSRACRPRSTNDVDASARAAIAETTSSTPAGSTARSARSKAAPFGGEHQRRARRDRRRAAARCTPGLQRVGRRDRRVGHADVHRRQREQRVLDAVAREDDDRPLVRQLAIEQRLRDAPHTRQRVGVGQRAATPPVGSRARRGTCGQARASAQCSSAR